jgi:ComF family protein
VLTKLSNILNDINTVLLPLACFGCNARLTRGEQLLCTVCRHEIPLTEYDFKEENSVDRIFYGRIKVQKAASFLFYSDVGIVKNLIHHLKYKKQEQIGAFLGTWYGSLLAENNHLKNRIDHVVPVPLHPRKLRKRGYNQVSAFAKGLAQHLECNCLENVLIKTANTRTQTKKNRLGRWFEDRSLYELTDPEILEGKNILLVDDVITTGATMEICAQALSKSTGVTIYIASMAVVP